MKAELARALAALGGTDLEPWLDPPPSPGLALGDLRDRGDRGDGASPRSLELARRNTLFRLRLSGRPAIAKCHRSHKAYAQERDAYLHFAPALAPNVPALLAELPEHRAIVLADLGGVPLEAAALDPAATRAAYAEAGRLLGRLHAIPVVDPDPVPLGAALLARLDRLAAEAPAAALAELRARLAAGGAGRRRGPCHRDFSPQNLLVLESGAIALVDFEHARLDDPHVDLARLFLTGVDLDAVAALRAAYPGPVDEAWLLALAELDARQTEAWARRHRDLEFLARAERGLARVFAHR